MTNVKSNEPPVLSWVQNRKLPRFVESMSETRDFCTHRFGERGGVSLSVFDVETTVD